jgi:hypothetical protein
MQSEAKLRSEVKLNVWFRSFFLMNIKRAVSHQQQQQVEAE